MEPTDITSYNPLPDVHVPREVYIDDDLERTLDNIQKLDFSNIEDDLDNFRLKEPQINTDSESVKTEGMLKLTKNQLRVPSLTNLHAKFMVLRPNSPGVPISEVN